MADTMESAFFIPKWMTGLFSAGVVGLVILGGIKRIGRVTARLTPLMALIYVLGALSILLLNYEHVIPSLIYIVKSAFSPEAGAFGIITGTFMNTMVWGVKRGLFSNEAGQGSAPIAHGAAKTEEPVREGVVALLEPFIDTLVICTMTGLVIIITGVWNVRHDAEINLNSLETELVFNNTANQSLNVENGIITNGSLKKSDVVIDTLYSNYDETNLLTGTITKKGDNFIATTEDGKTISSVYGEVVENGAPLTAMAFEAGLSPLFPGGQYVVTLCVFLFAISTSISWSYYGDRSIQFLLGDRSIIYYKVVYVGMHFIGAILTLATVWSIGDIALGLMTFPNLIALFALSGVVATASKKYFDKVKSETEQISE
jgi:AGCS family alanine or glycine:cation symporter